VLLALARAGAEWGRAGRRGRRERLRLPEGRRLVGARGALPRRPPAARASDPGLTRIAPRCAPGRGGGGGGGGAQAPSLLRRRSGRRLRPAAAAGASPRPPARRIQTLRSFAGH